MATSRLIAHSPHSTHCGGDLDCLLGQPGFGGRNFHLTVEVGAVLALPDLLQGGRGGWRDW